MRMAYYSAQAAQAQVTPSSGASQFHFSDPGFKRPRTSDPFKPLGRKDDCHVFFALGHCKRVDCPYTRGHRCRFCDNDNPDHAPQDCRPPPPRQNQAGRQNPRDNQGLPPAALNSHLEQVSGPASTTQDIRNPDDRWRSFPIGYVWFIEETILERPLKSEAWERNLHGDPDREFLLHMQLDMVLVLPLCTSDCNLLIEKLQVCLYKCFYGQ
jgi:hypothetical protein